MKPIKANQLASGLDDVRLTLSPRWALAGLSLSMLMPSLDTSIANVALPPMAQAFGASFQSIQWVVLVYLLAITSLIVSVGRLGDIFGRRRLLLAGISLFTLASLLCGLAGLLGTMSAIGTTLGPTLGGVLIAGFGWQTIFFINVPIGLATFLLACRYLPADRQYAEKIGAEKPGIDKIGTLLLTLTLVAYALAMTVGHGHFSRLNMALLLVSVLGVGLFVLAEKHVASPLIRLTMFRDPLLSTRLIMNTLVSTVMMATLVVGPFYLSHALGLQAATVGFLLSVGPLVAALTGVPAGRLVDRFRARRIIVMGLCAIATGSLLLFLLPLGFGVAGYIAPIAIITAGYALFQTANNTAVMSDVGPDQRGAVAGLLSLSRNLGLISGASAMGAVFAFASSAADITTAAPETVATGMRYTFAVAAFLIGNALAIGSIGQTLALARRHSNPVGTELN